LFFPYLLNLENIWLKYGWISSKIWINIQEVLIMTIEEMRKRKQELGYSYEKIAELSGVPVGTVQKVLGGITKSPRYETLQALETVFSRAAIDFLKEDTAPYYVKKQGEYTLADYVEFPDDQRVELIDGVIYDMASPTNLHQLISGEIYMRFSEYIRKNKGGCIAAYAPLDVQLDRDDRTMVQPDVMIICDRDKLRGNGVYGAPDLVVEILSASTRKKDSFKKLEKYSSAGVREYWLVDPDRKKVVVYDFAHEEYPVVYGFDHIVPVGIFDDKCRVDFSEIYEQVQFLYI
jgi:Uma2 family endonuclease